MTPTEFDLGVLEEVKPGQRLRMEFRIGSLGFLGYLIGMIDQQELQASLWVSEMLRGIFRSGEWGSVENRTVTVTVTEHFNPGRFREQVAPGLESLEIIQAVRFL